MAKKEQSGQDRPQFESQAPASVIDKLMQGVVQAGVPEAQSKDWIETLLGDPALEKIIRHSPRIMEALDQRIKELDDELSRVVNLVMHHPKFQKFEGSWRGLQKLVKRSVQAEQPFMRIQVLPITKDELIQDGNRLEYQESELYKKVYQKRFNTYGAIPLATMIADFEWSHEKEDVDGLTFLANIGSISHCPVVTAPSPKLLGAKKSEHWDQLDEMNFKSIDERINSPDVAEMTRFRAFREMEDSRYITMCMPRVLARVPYGKGQTEQKISEFGYQEFALAEDGNTVQLGPDQYCWSNAAYAMAACMMQSFDQTGWGANITGIESGGLLEDLPVHNYRSDRGDVRTQCPTEFSLSGTQSKTLSNVGILPLLWEVNSPRAFFQGTETVQKAQGYSRSEKGNFATSNARLAARLPYIMSVSRVVHWMQPRLLRMIGKRMDAEQIEQSLTAWLNDNLVEPGADPSEQAKAEKPFKFGQVIVRADERNPGAYFVDLKLVPHVMVEEIELGVSLVARSSADK